MATFKVGQRVKRIAVIDSRIPVGAVGVFVGYKDAVNCYVKWDAYAYPGWCWDAPTLAPLTDPKESEWADDAVKKVTKVHVEPVAPKITA